MPEVVKSVIIVMELEDDQEWFQEPEEPEEVSVSVVDDASEYFYI